MSGPDWVTVLQPRLLDLAKARREAPVVVAARRAAYAGRVVSADGQPIPGALVALQVPGSLRFGRGEVVDESTTLE